MSIFTDHDWDAAGAACLGCGVSKIAVQDDQVVAANPWLCPEDARIKAQRRYRGTIERTMRETLERLKTLDAEREDLVILRDHLQDRLDDLKEQ